jgi:hypothetical protein
MNSYMYACIDYLHTSKRKVNQKLGPQVQLDPLDDDELRHALMSIDTDLCLEDSIGQIIDILNE